jgi:hypothetical protein
MGDGLEEPREGLTTYAGPFTQWFEPFTQLRRGPHPTPKTAFTSSNRRYAAVVDCARVSFFFFA